MILKKRCPHCNKVSDNPTVQEIGGVVFTLHACGHEEFGVALSGGQDSLYSITSQTGEKPFPYQIAGARFIASSEGRALIADEMGLGKTIQFLMFVNAHQAQVGGKFLQIVKSGLKIQWLKQTMHWLGDEWMPQIIESEQDFILPVKGFIVSMDLLRRFKDPTKWAERLSISIVGIDEVQAIKNHDSARTNAVRKVVKNVEHVVALSGTPIKNHAGEYFPILNILHPERFPSLNRFYMNDVMTYRDGMGKIKVGGLMNTEDFRRKTGDFILRRTREEVQDEIMLKCGNVPFRAFQFGDLGKEVGELYQQTMDQFLDFELYGGEGMSAFEKSSNRLAYLSKMRHLAGIAKVTPCVDFVETFIMETSRKLTIFVHHKDVALSLYQKLEERRAGYPAEWGKSIATIEGGSDPIVRQAAVEQFASPDCRILIASTLASGEGLNLQFCSDCVMLERQWNPANEEQAEARFVRIGQLASRVNATYLVAVGTVDEFFSEIVERKRSICAQTLDGKEIAWEESSLMQELTSILVEQGKKKWK